ncbi:MAG TPA: ubiquinol-cytochrome C chaperone family protein [Novosphingobium sp.]|nr:ubiquinol-cytochrome C chaperone family protein [Novosphingobium sp.]
MSLLSKLFGAKPDDRAALRPLWHRVVEIAREPQWYSRGAIADTLEGRFDAITLVLALVLLRMEREAELIAPSVRLTELFVEDMDSQLRESGVGDLVVGKKIGKLMSVLGGRLGAYRDALATDGNELAEAVSRNVNLTEGASPALVAAEMRIIAGQLEAVPAATLLAGEIAR